MRFLVRVTVSKINLILNYWVGVEMLNILVHCNEA